MTDDTEIFSFRLPKSIRMLMRSYVSMDSHMSESDLVRNAIREYIEARVGKEKTFEMLAHSE